MFKELIDKLKLKKKQLQIYKTNIDNVETKSQKEKDNNIIVSKQGNIFKIIISDYLSIEEFFAQKNSRDDFSILDLLCNCVLWNSTKQKINKGIYYVINIENCLYNISFNDEKIEINEQIRKDNKIQERSITFYINKNEYSYYSAKHDQNGNTFYTKYYNKNKLYNLGALDLTEEETYNEINSIICNLENINGIDKIFDIELLKEHVLKDLSSNIKLK